jgi:hypothetical protein
VQVVRVRDLALAAAHAVGLGGAESRLRMVAGPLGVPGRSADLSLAAKLLGWAPQVDLATGLAHTSRWLEGEVAALRTHVAQVGVMGRVFALLCFALLCFHRIQSETHT